MPHSPASVADERGPQQQGRSRRSWRRWAAIAGAIALVALLIGAVVLARHWPFSLQNVTADLQDDFHGKVTFSRFHITVFPHPGCVAEDAKLVRDGSRPGDPPFAAAKKLIIRAHYLDFVARPGYVSHIEVEGLEIHIPPLGSEPPAAWGSSASTTRVGEVTANNSVLEIARKAGKPLRYELHKVILTSVSRKDGLAYDVSFLNALPPGEIRSRGHFGPWNSANPGETPVSGGYEFEHADLGIFPGIDGVLSSHDSFKGTLAKMETHGSVQIPDFKTKRAARGSPLESRFDSFVDALNGDVHLEQVETTIVKTKVLAKGSVEDEPGPRGKLTSVDLNVNRGRIQDLLRLFIKEPQSPIAGMISFRAHATVPPEGRPFEQEVVLVGDFGIDDGRFTKSETQEKVDSLSERAEGKKSETKEKGGKKTEDKDSDDDQPERVVSDLKGHVVLKNGIATFTNISFTIPGAVAYMHGTFNLLNEKIDFHGVLKTEAEFSKVGGGGIKSIFLKPFDAIFKKSAKGSEIPVKMTGTYSHPEPGLEITGGKKDDKKK